MKNGLEKKYEKIEEEGLNPKFLLENKVLGINGILMDILDQQNSESLNLNKHLKHDEYKEILGLISNVFFIEMDPEERQMLLAENRVNSQELENKLVLNLYNKFGCYDLNHFLEFLGLVKQDENLFQDILDLSERYFEIENSDLIIKNIISILKSINENYQLLPLKKLLEKIRITDDLGEKKVLMEDLDLCVELVLKNNKFYLEDKFNRIDVDIFEYLSSRNIVLHHNNYADSLVEISEEIRIEKFRLDELLNGKTVNKEKLKEYISLYGAKSGHLQSLKDHPEISKMIEIPDFEKIPVMIFNKWKVGGQISEDLKPYFDWVSERSVMVRSSAVYSEDGKDITGAGIYDSLLFKANGSIEDFEKIVIKIFESTDSKKAIAYREKNNVETEEMGILLQEFIEDYDVSHYGYANSVLKNVPGLMDIHLSGYDMNFLAIREIVEAQLARTKTWESLWHYQIDSKKVDIYEKNTVENLTAMIYKVVHFFQEEGQFEFAIPFDSDGRAYGLKLFQFRPLPKSYLEPLSVDFPEQDSLFEGRALGVFDEELEILCNKSDNSKEKGMVVFESSEFTSMGYKLNDSSFPRAGVVVVLGRSTENSGHIETLCAEKGLNLIFNDGCTLMHESIGMGFGFGSNDEAYGERITDFKGHKKVRAVSDGLNGKIYEV